MSQSMIHEKRSKKGAESGENVGGEGKEAGRAVARSSRLPYEPAGAIDYSALCSGTLAPSMR